SLPRRPNEAGLSLDQDLWLAVAAGEKLVWPDQVPDEAGTGTDEGGFINGLLMYPLPHGTSLLVCLGPADHSVDVDAVPEADKVANGWTTVVERGGRFEFPDPGITALAAAARARLLLAEPDLGHRLADRLKDGSGLTRRLLTRLRSRAATSADTDRERTGGTDLAEIETMVALAESGHLDRPARWLPIVAEALLVDPVDHPPPKLAGLVEAVARTAVLLEDAGSAELVVEPLARLTKQLESAGPASTEAWVKAATGLLALVDLLGQTEAACDLRSRLDQHGDHRPGASNGHDHLLVTDLVEQAHPAGRWTVVGDPRPDSLMEAARFWRAARGRLFRERLDIDEPTIELLPGFATSWRGGSVDVHEAATLYGRLSFAIRWHGARPALLWDQGDGRTTLICPALDPVWRSGDGRGETLLAGAPGGLADVPAPGESFI
ncbi:MAG: hypothetical protein OER95_20155, partial [Acidimicrobiia bacterium]|nr:hypothetical protein [Acidimicrobiia bacterium]